MAIQTLKKTRLQKCLVGCSAEDIDSSVHVVEVNATSKSMLLPVYICSTAVYCIPLSKCSCLQLGLRALKKAGREQSMRRFVQDAMLAMPVLASEFKAVAQNRFHIDLEVSVLPSRKPFYDFLTSEDGDDGQIS